MGQEKLQIAGETISAEMTEKEDKNEPPTKHTFRQRLWNYLIEEEYVGIPKNIFVIPCIRAMEDAYDAFESLEEFRSAKVLVVDPCKAQEPVRMSALIAHKEIIVPTGIGSKLRFLHKLPRPGLFTHEIRQSVSRAELLRYGTPLTLDHDSKASIFVVGSLCVSKEGYRIGEGRGFSDFEYAVLKEIGVIDHRTVVITIVDDFQVYEDLPKELFGPHDVPVDIIVTPTRIIRVEPRLPKPAGIIWELITPRKLKTVGMLKFLKEKEEKKGTKIVLSEEKEKGYQQYRGRIENGISPQKSENDPKNAKKKKAKKRSKSSDSRVPAKSKDSKPVVRNIDFSIKLSNIASSVRIRELKTELNSRGVKPSDITWRGQRGICYLHFGKLRKQTDSRPDQPLQVDSILTNLQNLQIKKFSESENNENREFIKVEPAEPITKIEVTDVTSV